MFSSAHDDNPLWAGEDLHERGGRDLDDARIFGASNGIFLPTARLLVGVHANVKNARAFWALDLTRKV